MKTTLLPILLFLLYPCLSSAEDTATSVRDIRFFAERITMSIHGEHVRVEGRYFFRNEGEQVIKSPILYPFPVDSSMLFPDSIHVSIVRSGGTLEKLAYREMKKGVTFGMEFPPGQSTEVVVAYRQLVKRRTARYILTSTRSWGKPLEEAEFFIEVPHDCEITSLSYDDFEPWKGEDRNVYHMKKTNFMPDTDISISWTDRTAP